MEKLIISSPEFIEGGLIPEKYSCKGEGLNPTLVIDQIPEGTQSMVLIMEDPDAPKGLFTHWVLFDIQPAGSIEEDSHQGVSGVNSRGETGYTPPCPPSGTHRYFFHVFALDRGLNLRPGSNRKAVEEAMRPYVTASGTLMGRYGEGMSQGSRQEGHGGADRTTVDETGAGAWAADKKVEH
ncbi:MAG: YbhB/YbcL family Raf kinase inhibitor-like protein [Bacteroidetes bacterium]|nr:YbhB/YbcL family Raf kinase inhibitor-like protein [Bacteroidota bacterium]